MKIKGNLLYNDAFKILDQSIFMLNLIEFYLIESKWLLTFFLYNPILFIGDEMQINQFDQEINSSILPT